MLSAEADLATEQERPLTTASANQTTGLTNGGAANWQRKSRLVLSVLFPVVNWPSRSVAKSAVYISCDVTIFCSARAIHAITIHLCEMFNGTTVLLIITTTVLTNKRHISRSICTKKL